MKQTQLQTPNLKNQSAFLPFFTRFIFVLFFGLTAFLVLKNVSAQADEKPQILPPTPFRIGEKFTYNVSFERFNNAGYAEIYVVSRGKLEGRDAVELRSKLKTSELVSAAFYLLDESRTTFASAETGLPLYIRKSSNASVLPKETISNFLIAPTANYDLLTLVYQIRYSGPSGIFSMQEDEKIYTVNTQNSANEKVKTDAGEFETSIATVQSEYFTEKGIRDLRINFSVDEQKIPVLIRFKTAKGEFRAMLASIQTIEPEPETSPTPVVIQTPRPVFTPTPKPTPPPYRENQPISPELPFVLGETLEYKISAGGQPVGTVLLQAKERKQFAGQDSLLVAATISNVQPGAGIFIPNDSIKAQINPETLAPYHFEIRFTGTLSSFNQTTLFDQKNGVAIFAGTNQTQIPVGTHNLLSLAYAIRSFNLKPSKDVKNPINDTRVAVFWDTQPYVFTLRPSDAELINLRGEKVSAQLVSIITGNPQLDSLNLRLWLSNDKKRLPLRFAVGNYQADLVSETIVKTQ